MYAFLNYFMVGEGGSNGWSSVDSSTGSSYYKSIADLLLELSQEPVQEQERLNALVLWDRVAKWNNPLCLAARALIGEGGDADPLASRYRALFRKRVAGQTRVPEAVATALKGSILGLPTES